MAQSCMVECKVSEYINCEHYDDANSLAFGQFFTELRGNNVDISVNPK